jgi:hypothetical protein
MKNQYFGDINDYLKYGMKRPRMCERALLSLRRQNTYRAVLPGSVESAAGTP